MKIQSKQLLQYYRYQLSISYWRILPYNHIVGSYDRIQHVIIMDLDLVHFYLTMCYIPELHNDHKVPIRVQTLPLDISMLQNIFLMHTIF